MMAESTNYLLFTLCGQRCALPAAAVDRIVQLPALTPLPGGPVYVAGVFDLGQTMVPVLDLSVLLNKRPKRHVLTDSVIVLHGNPTPLGIIANEVSDVRTISDPGRETNIRHLGEKAGRGIVAAVLRVENELVLLLSVEDLIRTEAGIEHLTDRLPAQALSTEHVLVPDSPAREQELFRERTLSLTKEVDDEDYAGFLRLVLIGLNGEYFGLPLEAVREFCEIRSLAPVPCCPRHIAGAVNLRGEILTVIDIRPLLKMDATEIPQKKYVVLDHVGITVGALIDEVYDVVYIDPSQVTEMPLVSDSEASGYLKGTAMWDGHTLTILDSMKLLTSGELVVSDEV